MERVKMKKRLSMVMIVIYIFSCVILPTNATKLDKAKSEQKKVNNQISQIAKEKKSLSRCNKAKIS
jgi:uncharacterized protein YpmB